MKHFLFRFMSTKMRRIDTLSPKKGIKLALTDRPGELIKVLQILYEHNINLSCLSTKPSLHYNNQNAKIIDISIDFETEKNETKVEAAIRKLKDFNQSVTFNSLKEVPWFPKSLLDLNKIGRDIKVGGETLLNDHPGFYDPIYKARRTEIEQDSKDFLFSENNNVNFVNYTEEENNLWTYMWDKITPLQNEYACDEFKENMDKLVKAKVLGREKIPQLRDINHYFKNTTKMFFRPTGGLLSSREFLNTLAFRVFPSTQYIRHKSKPLYTPEPDLIHEILGHCVMFSNEEFTNFTQEIGLASLGASDIEIQKLANIYWYTIEFGLCKQNSDLKIFGGGILSSPSELYNCFSGEVKHHEFSLKAMTELIPDICHIQTEYFIAPSFKKMVEEVRSYSTQINRSFNLSYHSEMNCVDVDRTII